MLHSNKLQINQIAEIMYFFYNNPQLVLQMSPLQYSEFIEELTKLEKEYKHIASRVNLLLLNASKTHRTVETGNIPMTGTDLDLIL